MTPEITTVPSSYWHDEAKKAAALAKRAVSPGYASAERGKRISAAAKARWADPEYAARMRAAMAAARVNAVPKGKPVTVAGIQYPSMKAAKAATGLSALDVQILRREQTKESV